MSVQLLAALPVTAIFAALAYALGMVSRNGALGGVFVGTLIFACLGPQGFAILALFVVGGSALTRLGYERKSRSRIAQEGGGRRGVKNALANCSVAVVCALLATMTSSDAFAVAFVASLGAAFADTAESEIGQLSRAQPWLVTNFRRVQPGTDGGVSLPGTLAGVGAAAVTAALGYAFGLVGSGGAAVVVAFFAFLGTLADSIIGALFPRVGNEVTNLLCTLIAAALTLFFAS